MAHVMVGEFEIPAIVDEMLRLTSHPGSLSLSIPGGSAGGPRSSRPPVNGTTRLLVLLGELVGVRSDVGDALSGDPLASGRVLEAD